ncbi:DNA-binding protein [Pseudomonas sp. PIC25]|uniref:DNA-binding protein n=1 Tax=Pseudomonas sp. PIC25 TaxID=1958773 RepID=UPI000BCC1F67|nr:DNA-binding protein [Pseudomonas sp. PIC25]PAU65547.1 DNA-binding protein [Pseudomonas sp. PIC25]
MDEILDRAIQLLRMMGPKKLSQLGETSHERWKTISKRAVRMNTEEIDVLVKIYPQYALWLASGQIAPEFGQTSPEYDEAHSGVSTTSKAPGQSPS